MRYTPPPPHTHKIKKIIPKNSSSRLSEALYTALHLIHVSPMKMDTTQNTGILAVMLYVKYNLRTLAIQKIESLFGKR